MASGSPFGYGGHPQRSRPGRTASRALGLVVLGLIVFSHPCHVEADLIWEQLWADDFEPSMDPRWTVDTFGRGDVLGVEEEHYIPKCYNRYLAGRSPDRPGCGYVASTPTLDDLGLDPMAPRYVIRFRYRLPDADFCWTLPLASPDITLVASECSNSGKARIGVAGYGVDDVRCCTELELGVWHDFKIVVDRDVFTDTRVARVYVDGSLVATEMRSGAPLWPNVTFMDLPVRPVSVEDGEMPSSSACFGSGNWDDVRITALQPVTPDGGGRDDPDIRDGGLGVYPNPANPVTVLRTRLPHASPLEVRIYDVRGRLVRNLFSGVHPMGAVALRWRGDDDAGREAASGAYVIRVSTPEGSRIARVALTR